MPSATMRASSAPSSPASRRRARGSGRTAGPLTARPARRGSKTLKWHAQVSEGWSLRWLNAKATASVSRLSSTMQDRCVQTREKAARWMPPARSSPPGMGAGSRTATQGTLATTKSTPSHTPAKAASGATSASAVGSNVGLGSGASLEKWMR
jgi:hypothetical protein